jgi:predicted nucleic acid-binding protein
MPTYLLDSSVIIDTLNKKRDRDQLLKNLLIEGHLLACCSISVTEIYAGMRSHEELPTTELLKSLQFFPVTFAIARLAGLLKRDHAKKGITLAATDVTIAAVAIAHHLTLITDNIKHYPMKELSLYPLPVSQAN